MTSINTNSASVIAANALKVNERNMSTAMERLSTGVRINSAKDDAAGLAIVKKMDAQVSGLRQAARNANDGISMLQTFEGASKEITTMLNRMRDLTVQASNGTYTTDDVASLGEEYTALRAEIGRIIDATQWNGMAKMDAGGKVNLQIGANSGTAETMEISIMDWDAGSSTSLTNTETDHTGTTAEKQTIDLVAMDEGDSLTFAYTDPSGNRQEYTFTAEKNYADGDAVEAAILLAQAAADGNASSLLSGFQFQAGGAAGEIDIEYDANNVEVYEVTATLNAGTGSAIPSDWSTRSIADLDSKISNVTAERAKYGAYISRLESASDNLLSVAQNTDASRGQIEDADYAAETTELARTQIIAQAGTAMLAQANQIKQSVLALLK
jgi:flagellin